VITHKNSECDSDGLKEIEVTDLGVLLSEHDALVLDVREYQEHPKLMGAHYLQIPMSILNKESLIAVESKHIIFLCQHGIRSLHAAELFHDQLHMEKKFYSLKGGVVRWKAELSDLGLLG
jgi:rhodanese-related sulfurtransferase